ncbi:hypothetical protein [Burkholderia ubonensis]|uniref:hypothetical protein n=1 Tax=Burkholderia ubonensis TaxID=101571 RepID=UPI0018DF9BBA|nr:hypothetical protein [Burkholderia ubonensis]
MKNLAVAIVLALSVVRVFACVGAENQPGETTDVTFEHNVSTPSNASVLKLANWVIDLRAKYPTFEAVAVIGLAEIGERNPEELATARAAQVQNSLQLLSAHASKVSVSAHVYKPMLPGSKYEPSGARVEVTLIPGCPNNCCDAK